MFPGLGVPPGPATEPHVVKKGGPQWPQGEFRVVSPVPPGPGWNKQRTEIPRPSSPAGTAAAECPEEEEPPAWEAPTAQISQRASSPQGRGRLTMRHKAAKQTSSSAWKWRGKKGGLGLGRHISAAGRPAGSAWIRYKEARAQQGTSGLYVYVDRYVEIEKGRADDGSR